MFHDSLFFIGSSYRIDKFSKCSLEFHPDILYSMIDNYFQVQMI